MKLERLKNILRSSLYLTVLSLAVMIILAGLAPDPVGRWAHNFWLWVDQGVNTVVLLGDPQETISSRLGKYMLEGEGWMHDLLVRPTCWFLDLFEADHCVNSVDPNVGGRSVL